MDFDNPPNKQAQFAAWKIAVIIPITIFNNSYLNLRHPQKKKPSQSLAKTYKKKPHQFLN